MFLSFGFYICGLLELFFDKSYSSIGRIFTKRTITWVVINVFEVSVLISYSNDRSRIILEYLGLHNFKMALIYGAVFHDPTLRF